MGVSRVVEIDTAGARIRLILSDSTCGAPPRRGQISPRVGFTVRSCSTPPRSPMRTFAMRRFEIENVSPSPEKESKADNFVLFRRHVHELSPRTETAKRLVGASPASEIIRIPASFPSKGLARRLGFSCGNVRNHRSARMHHHQLVRHGVIAGDWTVCHLAGALQQIFDCLIEAVNVRAHLHSGLFSML
jgi:hypothetical protein